MTAILVASLVGAALFFVAGAVTMSLRTARPDSAVDDGTVQRQRAVLAELEAELARTRSAVDHERVAADLSRSELATVRGQLERAEAQLVEQKTVVRTRRPSTAGADIEALRARADRAEVDRDAQKMRADRAEAERKAEYLRADRAEAERNAQQARAERAEASLAERTSVDAGPVHVRAERAETELKAHAIRSRAEIDLLKTRLDRADDERKTLKTRMERAEAERDAQAMRAAQAQSERDALVARADRAEGELASLTSRMAELRDELERTRADATSIAVDGDRTTARLAELQQQLIERAQTVRDLATENEQLKGRLRDAEGLRADYVRLRTASVETEFLKSEVARLERELRAVRVDALGGAKAPAPTRSGRVTGLQPTSSPGTISESLVGVLDRFADGNTRSLAISDLIGFPLASTGADAQALAAYATLLADAAGRADQFLPVARPVSIEVIDERGARLSVWPFDVAGDRLLLANLSVASVDKTRVDTTLAALAKILAPSAIAS